MPQYIAKTLNKFQHETSQRAQHAPHAWTAPNYGAKTQVTEPQDTSAPLDAGRITRIQEIIGTLLYYAQAIDSTMLVAFGTLASQQSTGTGHRPGHHTAPQLLRNASIRRRLLSGQRNATPHPQ
jgi:hypothetical protein